MLVGQWDGNAATVEDVNLTGILGILQKWLNSFGPSVRGNKAQPGDAHLSLWNDTNAKKVYSSLSVQYQSYTYLFDMELHKEIWEMILFTFIQMNKKMNLSGKEEVLITFWLSFSCWVWPVEGSFSYMACELFGGINLIMEYYSAIKKKIFESVLLSLL